MGSAQYEDHMSEIEPVDTEAQIEAFKKLHELADKIHIGELPEIERFKSIMDKLMAIEQDIKLIKKHFNIVQIIE